MAEEKLRVKSGKCVDVSPWKKYEEWTDRTVQQMVLSRQVTPMAKPGCMAFCPVARP